MLVWNKKEGFNLNPSFLYNYTDILCFLIDFFLIILIITNKNINKIIDKHIKYITIFFFIKSLKDLNMDFLKYPIVVIHEIGEQIFDLYEKNGREEETYTRFNIYDLGQVLFDDHRSVESFVPKCKCPVVPCDFRKNEDNKKKIMER